MERLIEIGDKVSYIDIKAFPRKCSFSMTAKTGKYLGPYDDKGELAKIEKRGGRMVIVKMSGVRAIDKPNALSEGLVKRSIQS